MNSHWNFRCDVRSLIMVWLVVTDWYCYHWSRSLMHCCNMLNSGVDRHRVAHRGLMDRRMHNRESLVSGRVHGSREVDIVGRNDMRRFGMGLRMHSMSPLHRLAMLISAYVQLNCVLDLVRALFG